MTEQTPADTRPDHTDTIARLFSSDEDRCGTPSWTNAYVGEQIVRLLLDPSNRAALIDAILDAGTDDILDALMQRGVLEEEQTGSFGRMHVRLVEPWWREVDL